MKYVIHGMILVVCHIITEINGLKTLTRVQTDVDNNTTVNGTGNWMPDLRIAEGTSFHCHSGFSLIRFICKVVITLLLAVLGLTGNSLLFAILYKQRAHITTNLMLQALAVTDNMVLLVATVFSLDHLYGCSSKAAMRASGRYYVLVSVYPTFYAIRMVQTWLTSLLTIERWMAICQPNRLRRFTCKHGAVWKILTVVICAIVVSLPRFFEYRLLKRKNGKTYLGKTAMVSNHFYVYAYKVALFLLLMYIIPMVLMVVFNTKLFIALRRNQCNIRKTKSVTKVVLIIVLIFLLCNIPPLISQLIWSLEATIPSIHHMEGLRSLIITSNIMVVMNSSVNFIVYYVCSKKFRKNFKSMISCSRKGSAGDKPGQSTITSMSSANAERVEMKQNEN